MCLSCVLRVGGLEVMLLRVCIARASLTELTENSLTEVIETAAGSTDKPRATSTIYWRLMAISNALLFTETITENVTYACGGAGVVAGGGLVVPSSDTVV